MPDPEFTDAQLAQARELGRLTAPFLTVYVATQLVCARFSAPSGMPASPEWRAGVIRESIDDALQILKVI